MILQISVGNLVTISFDDEITDERPTPEVVDDYLTRLRQQAMDAYLAVPDTEPAEAGADPDA